MNLFELVGTVCEEPVVSESNSGIKIAKLRLSVDKSGLSENKEADIVEVTLFKELATKQFNIGDIVAVTGRISSFKTDREKTYYNLSLCANSVATL